MCLTLLLGKFFHSVLPAYTIRVTQYLPGELFYLLIMQKVLDEGKNSLHQEGRGQELYMLRGLV